MSVKYNDFKTWPYILYPFVSNFIFLIRFFIYLFNDFGNSFKLNFIKVSTHDGLEIQHKTK